MNVHSASNTPYILGLDVGARSIGWAILRCVDENGEIGEPTGILAAGVRLFEAGVEGAVDKGTDESRATARRMQRLARRQLFRRAQRLRRVMRSLAAVGLLPGGVASPPESRQAYLDGLDRVLKHRLIAAGEDATAVHDKLPYLLRRLCLDGPRPIEEVGRALFHLAQRRGFLSNRRAGKKDDEKGVVKQGIKAVQEMLQRHSARTLGELLAGLNPHETRIRSRYTSRRMYEQEFDAIWRAQSPHHPAVMTDDARDAIREAIFHQRPLKSQSKLIGRCELEPHKRRAPIACLRYQRFRLIQKVNDLTWRDATGALCGPLAFDDPRRAELIRRLDEAGDLTLAEVKKTLKLPAKAKLLFEEGADKKLPGNRTAQAMREALGASWDALDAVQRNALVDEFISGMDERTFSARARSVYGLSDAQVEELLDTELQQGYGAYSRRAMKKLLVEMEAGVPLMTARKKLYPNAGNSGAALTRLPPVLTEAGRRRLGLITNPAVVRTLTELRKVVNGLVGRYGLPERIRIELGRDLRNSRDERQAATKRIAERTKQREQFAKEIRRELPNVFGRRELRRSDLEKWALFKECGGICPYTGKSINPGDLFGDAPLFDVEHIVPRSRRPDDSFVNKTLCCVKENRSVKGDRTPFEAYASDPKRWAEILARVSRFTSPLARAKLRLFQMEQLSEEFVNRDLNDTRYASRQAMDYLGLLYGGVNGVDPAGVRRVQASCGGITATLRNEWGLNQLLSATAEKAREDHRHHAVDAVVIALTSPRTVKLLANSAARAASEGRQRYAQVPEPWAGFRQDVGDVIEKVVVSHRVDYRLAGGLHQATNYSPAKPGVETVRTMATKSREAGEKQVTAEFRHVRVPLSRLSRADLDNIVDQRVREAVVAAAGGGDPAKVFKVEANLPRLPNRNGPPRIIRKVRVREKIRLLAVGGSVGRGGPGATRFVAPDENSHLEVVEFTDANGKVTWEIDHIVSRFEAHRRHIAGEPVIRTAWGPGRRLVMVLRRGDHLWLDIDGRRVLQRVRSIGDSWIQTSPLSFAGPKMPKEMLNAGLYQSGSRLRAANPQLVSVSPLGDVRPYSAVPKPPTLPNPPMP